MAPVITESTLIKVGGHLPGMIKLYGSVANDTTSFVVKPGNNDVNIDGSLGLRKILAYGFNNITAEKAPIVVKSFDTSQNGDILTVTCANSDDYTFWIEGLDDGVA